MLKPLNKNIVLKKKEEIENKTASGIILTTETKRVFLLLEKLWQ